MSDDDDALWPHFEPLWKDLQNISTGFTVIGGYGLFLKHHWLLEQLSNPDTQIRTVVPIERWREGPRVTKDMDLLTEIDLIASEDRNKETAAALQKNGFESVKENAYWQFSKKVGEKEIIAELHAPLVPNGARVDIESKGCRVKRKPSLGDKGIHGHINREASEADVAALEFVYRGVAIRTTHPVITAQMKLVAMGDKFKEAFDPEQAEGKRRNANRMAQKHAEDVFRAVAMMTREESDSSQKVVEEVFQSVAFQKAARSFQDYCRDDNLHGFESVRDKWHPDDLYPLRDILARWLTFADGLAPTS